MAPCYHSKNLACKADLRQNAEVRILNSEAVNSEVVKEMLLMLKWKATAMALGVALTIAVFMLHAKSSSLTALDYIQIQQLANRYGQTAPGSSEK
jgi:hypothetical protein